MNKRLALVTALAAGHLLLVVCGAARVSPGSDDSFAGRVFRWYGAMSGSDSGYGFFAPGVAQECRATFTLSDAAGRTWEDTLARGHNPEVTDRIGVIVSLFSEPRLRPRLAGS